MNARFGNLSGRGPLGQKAERAPKSPTRKAVKKISDKRAAYLASPERQAGLAHMARVARLPCLACGAFGVEVHHEGTPRSDLRVLPLCIRHHQRAYGPGARHYSPKAFYAAHGDSQALLDRVEQMLRDLDNDLIGEWF